MILLQKFVTRVTLFVTEKVLILSCFRTFYILVTMLQIFFPIAGY